jgi:hypothetical protein
MSQVKMHLRQNSSSAFTNRASLATMLVPIPPRCKDSYYGSQAKIQSRMLILLPQTYAAPETRLSRRE